MSPIKPKTQHSKVKSETGFIRYVRNFEEASYELDKITNRTTGKRQEEAIRTVDSILKTIEEEGDIALKKHTKHFDGFLADPLNVSASDLKAAWETTPRNLQNALEKAKERIERFHKLQIPKDISLKGDYGEKLGRKWNPVKKAGIYIPGGRAAYPSTVLMNAIPAIVAGVEEIVMVSPGNTDGKINQTVLAAAYLTGIKQVFRVGGAQAIGALAFGTNSIPKVDVISGPGNLYVTLAKKSVYGKVGIDSLAGPSEVLIIADHTAKLKHVATDLLAQSEHDPLASAILITTEKRLAEDITDEISRQLNKHPRAEICKNSLKEWGLIVLCEEIDSCAKLSNQFAPEHLELLIDNPHNLIPKIHNAGAIFIGPWSPEAVGDYLAGPNHTLPTSGTARFSGALSVETFMKNTSLIEFSQSAFMNTSNEVIELAKSEGLHSHARSISERIPNTLA